MDKSAPVKSKRDEWSQSGVLFLLDVYESKWLLRNRAKLKRSDWEDIAHKVSLFFSDKSSLKTPNQCKNKIESMKKRYRSEAAAAADQASSCSSWQFFDRMDCLLKGAPNFPTFPKSYTLPLNLDEGKSRGVDSYCSTSRCKQDVIQNDVFKRRKGMKEVGESIQLLAHSIMKIEHGRMEMFKDLERTRAEVEIKKGEMELKRTEIVSKTQLQIADLFVKRLYGKTNVKEGSHLKNELQMLSTREVMGD